MSEYAQKIIKETEEWIRRSVGEGGVVQVGIEKSMFERAVEMAVLAEREACCTLLEGMHEAQRGNQNHNYYAYAAIEIRKLRKEK